MKLVFIYKELISFVFSRAFAKNFDCRTYVRRRSFFTKNNFVSLALYQLEDFVFKLKGALLRGLPCFF